MNEQMREAVNSKALEIHTEGLRKLKSGQVKPFAGFDSDPNLKLRGGAFLEFTWGSNKRYRELVKKIKVAAGRLGISMIGAVDDYPAHITVKDTPVLSEEKLCEFFSRSFGLWQDLTDEAIGTKIVLDYMPLDGVNVLFLTLDIPDRVQVMRQMFERFCQKFGWPERTSPPLCHSSATKMIQIPKATNFDWYILEMDKIREELNKDPLVATISGVHLGQMYNFLMGVD